MRQFVFPALALLVALSACGPVPTSQVPMARQITQKSPAEFCSDMGQLATGVMITRQNGMRKEESVQRALYATRSHPDLRGLLIGIVDAAWEAPIERTPARRAEVSMAFGKLNQAHCLQRV